MDKSVVYHYKYHVAFLWKKPNSKYWQAGFMDKSGKRRNRSTGVEIKGAVSRKVAQRLADQYEDASRRQRTAKQVREVIMGLYQEITGDEMPQLTVREHTKAWLIRKKPEVKTSTYNFYKGVSTHFLDFMGDRADIDIAKVTREDITEYRNKLAETLAGKTVNHKIKALRMIFKDAERERLLLENPTAFVDTVRVNASDQVNRVPFKMDELRRVISCADEEWRSMIIFGLYTGQRLGDIAKLTWANVDLDTKEVILVTSKTGRRMRIPMAKPLVEHVKSLPAGDSSDMPIHPRASGILENSDGRTGGLSNQFAKILESAGLREKTTHASTGKGRNVQRIIHPLSFHCLRHTAVTLLHEAGVPAAVAQTLIGHDSEEMHQIYISVGDKAIREAAGKMPKI
ncbi:tyrosine-type recombinase/integrase [Oceaniferula spumae]|uniref:tyrosine-type recombinase/integrase n=1 Tax=Oceaniferula spumae TaxID=2979115 RepID=UPI003F4E669F